MKRFPIRCLPGVYIFLAVALILVPIKWLLAWLTAALLHELFHILFLWICGGSVTSVELGFMGAKIYTDDLSGLKMSVCALAGPLAGALLALTIRITPRLALCGAIQSIYNLVPLYPFDGGRAVKGIAEQFLSGGTAVKFLRIWENTVLLLLSAFALFSIFFFQMGIFLLVWVSVLVYKNKKIPCKGKRLRVQ